MVTLLIADAAVAAVDVAMRTHRTEEGGTRMGTVKSRRETRNSGGGSDVTVTT